MPHENRSATRAVTCAYVRNDIVADELKEAFRAAGVGLVTRSVAVRDWRKFVRSIHARNPNDDQLWDHRAALEKAHVRHSRGKLRLVVRVENDGDWHRVACRGRALWNGNEDASASATTSRGNRLRRPREANGLSMYARRNAENAR